MKIIKKIINWYEKHSIKKLRIHNYRKMIKQLIIKNHKLHKKIDVLTHQNQKLTHEITVLKKSTIQYLKEARIN